MKLHIAALGIDSMYYRVGPRAMVLIRGDQHTCVVMPFTYVAAAEAMGFHGIPCAFFNNYEKQLRASGVRNDSDWCE